MSEPFMFVVKYHNRAALFCRVGDIIAVCEKTWLRYNKNRTYI